MHAHPIAIAFLVASCIPLVFAISNMRLAHRCRAWLEVDGEIVKAWAEPITSGEGYCVQVRYAYQHNGMKYESNKTDLGLLITQPQNRKHFQTEDSAKQYASKLLSARGVRVWVDPSDASRALLDRSFPVVFILVLFLGAITMMAIGISLL